MPDWITAAAVPWLIIAGACASVIVIDLVAGHRQHMAVMNVVWPITGLYAGPVALWAYFTLGRASTRDAVRHAHRVGQMPPSRRRPMWQTVALATTHCGAGCTLGDLLAEGCAAFVPMAILGSTILATWTLAFAFAFAFGIAFQFFTIAPMRNLAWRDGLVAALKADSLSLLAWQVGMYGWMAIVIFVIVGHELSSADPVFWFMMQIAMLVGFLTSYPVNWWLVRSGIKERM